MKIKLSELRPNPFKENINGGKLDEGTIEKLMANMDQDRLGFMGSLAVSKKNNVWYIVNGHHRVEALKRKFGKDFFIECTPQEYSEDQMLRGMVIENLTQRMNEFREESDNVSLVKNYLETKKILLDDNGKIMNYCPPSGQKLPGRPKDTFEFGSVRQICLWLDKDTGAVMRKSKIADLLHIKEKLAPDLQEKVEKQSHAVGEKDDEESLGVKEATFLAGFDDHQEQRDLAKALRNSREQHGNLKQKNITAYKNASDDVKRKVRQGILDIADIEDAERDSILVEHDSQHPRLEFIPDFGERVKQFHYDVLELEKQIRAFSAVFRSKDFKERYSLLNNKQKKFFGTTIANIRLRVKKCYEEIEYFNSTFPDKDLLVESKQEE